MVAGAANQWFSQTGKVKYSFLPGFNRPAVTFAKGGSRVVELQAVKASRTVVSNNKNVAPLNYYAPGSRGVYAI